MFEIIFVICFILILTYFLGGVSAAPWVPTHSYDVERLISLGKIKAGEKVYDLGCGDGRLLVPLARLGAQTVGYEISLLPILIFKIKTRFKNQPNLKILYKNFWKQNLRDADVVVFFLLPKIFPRLKKKLFAELKPGTRVISCCWPLPNLAPAAIDAPPNRLKFYLYEIPEPTTNLSVSANQ